MTGRTKTIVIGLVGAAALAAPGAALAGIPGETESLGETRGLEYMRAQHKNVVDQVAQPALCDGSSVVGGGGAINGPADNAALHETYPDLSGPGSGWQSEASTSGAPRRLTTWAVCSLLTPDYHSSQSPLDTNTVAHRLELCADPTEPIAGGLSATGPGMSLVGNRASLTSIPTGWAPTVWNNTMNDTLADAYGVCSDDFVVRYRTDRTKLRPDQSGTAIARCGRKEAVLSGGFVGRKGNVIGFRTVAVGTKPWDTKADGNKIPDDGWQVRARNAETFNVDLQAQAVCKRGLAPTR